MIAALMLLAQVPSGTTFVCTPTAVWDGDGPIWCEEGPKIRLAGIAAREIDETCKRGHPCPAASGRAARDALVLLVGRRVGVGSHGHILVKGPPLRCRSEGSGKGARTAAWCVTPKGVDLSCELVRIDVAVPWAAYKGAQVCRRSGRGSGFGSR